MVNIGKKIKGFRIKNELTIQELSDRIGLSTALLSQLERGIGNPTISALDTIATALGTTVSELLAAEIENKDLVVRKNERKIVFDGNNKHIMYSILSDKVVNTSFDVMVIQLEPYAQTDSRFRQHPEEESVLVLEGEMTFEFDNESITLYEGDTIRILSNRGHMISNNTDKRCVALNIKSKLRY